MKNRLSQMLINIGWFFENLGYKFYPVEETDNMAQANYSPVYPEWLVDSMMGGVTGDKTYKYQYDYEPEYCCDSACDKDECECKGCSCSNTVFDFGGITCD